eukprot:469282-Rhodomonas_salina.1
MSGSDVVRHYGDRIAPYTMAVPNIAKHHTLSWYRTSHSTIHDGSTTHRMAPYAVSYRTSHSTYRAREILDGILSVLTPPYARSVPDST